MFASVTVSIRAERVEFGQYVQEKHHVYCGDPPASLHKLITTRGQEKLLSSSTQM